MFVVTDEGSNIGNHTEKLLARTERRKCTDLTTARAWTLARTKTTGFRTRQSVTVTTEREYLRRG